MANFIGYKCNIYNKSCLDIDWSGYDLVFTSPPFFNKERYIGGAQPWVTHKTRDSWQNSFVKLFVDKCKCLTVLYLDKETMIDFELFRKFDEIVVVQNRKHVRQKLGEEYLCVYR
jgi:hypothetical protein